MRREKPDARIQRRTHFFSDSPSRPMPEMGRMLDHGEAKSMRSIVVWLMNGVRKVDNYASLTWALSARASRCRARPWRTSSPRTQKSMSSAMFVAWSAMRSK